MIKLSSALNSWNTPDFKHILKREIEHLDAGKLPLQQGLSMGSYASEKNISITILAIKEDRDIIRVKTGIFFTGLIPGCSCADDPAPNNEYSEYCEVQFDINKISAETSITLIAE